MADRAQTSVQASFISYTRLVLAWPSDCCRFSRHRRSESGMEDVLLHEGERSTALQTFTGLLGLFQEALWTLGGEDFIVLVRSTVVNFENIFLAFHFILLFVPGQGWVIALWFYCCY